MVHRYKTSVHNGFDSRREKNVRCDEGFCVAGKCGSEYANERINDKVNAVQNSYSGRSVSFFVFRKFTWHLKFRTPQRNAEHKWASTHRSMREITSGTFGSISPGIFNYSFPIFRPASTLRKSFETHYSEDSLSAFGCDKPGDEVKFMMNGIFILKLQLFLWFLIFASSICPCWRRKKWMLRKWREMEDTLARCRWKETVDVDGSAQFLCTVSTDGVRAYWVIDRHNNGGRPTQ